MRRAMTILLVLGFAGCSGTVPVDHEEHDFEDDETVDLGDQPWRDRRRMDIDQLDASIRVATGGIGWEAFRRDGDDWEVRRRYFDYYGDTLGVPDWINSSSEDLTVSLLFEKFLDDAARDVCRRLVDREAGRGREYDGAPIGLFDPVDLDPAEEDPPPSTEEVDAVLARLLLRFHGRPVEPGSEALTPWRALHDRASAAVTADDELPARRAWEGVCVALITHPDFYTY